MSLGIPKETNRLLFGPRRFSSNVSQCPLHLGREGEPTDTFRSQSDARGRREEAGEEQRHAEGILQKCRGLRLGANRGNKTGAVEKKG